MVVTPKIAYSANLVTANVIAGYFNKHSGHSTIANHTRLEKDGLDKDGLEKDGLDKDGLDKDGLDKDGLDKGGLDKGGLDKGGLDKGGLDKHGLDTTTNQVINNVRAAGISKEEMLNIVTYDFASMYFNVLFLESCKSDLGMLLMDIAEFEGRVNVGYLFMSDEKGLSYNTVSWNESAHPAATSLRTWLANHLNAIAAKATRK
jgi:pentapeptide MXKDX repeat protein